MLPLLIIAMELAVVVKSDVQGSLEAIVGSLEKLSDLLADRCSGLLLGEKPARA